MVKTDQALGQSSRDLQLREVEQFLYREAYLLDRDKLAEVFACEFGGGAHP